MSTSRKIKRAGSDFLVGILHLDNAIGSARRAIDGRVSWPDICNQNVCQVVNGEHASGEQSDLNHDSSGLQIRF